MSNVGITFLARKSSVGHTFEQSMFSLISDRSGHGDHVFEDESVSRALEKVRTEVASVHGGKAASDHPEPSKWCHTWPPLMRACVYVCTFVHPGNSIAKCSNVPTFSFRPRSGTCCNEARNLTTFDTRSSFPQTWNIIIAQKMDTCGLDPWTIRSCQIRLMIESLPPFGWPNFRSCHAEGTPSN